MPAALNAATVASAAVAPCSTSNALLGAHAWGLPAASTPMIEHVTSIVATCVSASPPVPDTEDEAEKPSSPLLTSSPAMGFSIVSLGASALSSSEPTAGSQGVCAASSSTPSVCFASVPESASAPSVVCTTPAASVASSAPTTFASADAGTIDVANDIAIIRSINFLRKPAPGS